MALGTWETPHAPLGIPLFVWMLTLSALAARLAWVLLRGEWDESTAMEHASLATSFVAGEGFAFNETGDYTQHGLYEPSSVQSPPYPLLLAALYGLFGVKSAAAHFVAQMINALAGAATVPLGYSMVRRIGGRHETGVLTAALLAFWPTQVFAVAFVQAITLITLGTIAIVVLWYRSLDTGRLGPWIAFGVVGCLAALTEPVLLPAMALAGVIILLHPKLAPPLRLRNAAILLVIAIVVMGPWSYRNWRVHGVIVPVKSTFWVNVWKGNNPYASGTDRPTLTAAQLERFRALGQDNLRQYDLLTDAQRQELDGRATAEREAIWKRYATSFIRENPGRYIELCGLRLAKTLWAEWDNPKSHDRFYVYFGSRAILLLGSGVGLIVAIRRRWRIGWPAVIVGTSLATYTLTITAARFAFPLEPFQIALTSLALMAAWQALFGATRRPPIVRRFAGELNDGIPADPPPAADGLTPVRG